MGDAGDGDALLSGGRVSCHYTNRRAVVTMDGLLGLRLKVRRCVNRGCGRFHRAFRPEAEGAIVLPGSRPACWCR